MANKDYGGQEISLVVGDQKIKLDMSNNVSFADAVAEVVLKTMGIEALINFLTLEERVDSGNGEFVEWRLDEHIEALMNPSDWVLHQTSHILNLRSRP